MSADRVSGTGEDDAPAVPPRDGWTPADEVRRDVVTAAAARSLHDLLDRPGPAPADGDPLPILWQWLAFLPQARQSEIGADGHPVTGGFLPPTGGRQRMFAGARASFSGAIRVGEPLSRRSRVTGVVEKNGRSGPLLFVTVDHRITGDGGSVLREGNDIVYKGAAPQGSATAPAPAVSPSAMERPAIAESDWALRRTVAVDPTLLFRFSALTYNAHRIHYDRRYVTEVEGYPGLVIHGPLQAILLADLAQREFPGRPIASFTFRALSPAFDGDPLEIRGRLVASGDSGGGADAVLELAAFTKGGRQTMSAKATIGSEAEEA